MTGNSYEPHRTKIVMKQQKIHIHNCVIEYISSDHSAIMVEVE